MSDSPRGVNLSSDSLDGECFLRVSDLAERWHVHPVTVRKWMASDLLPCVHVGPGPRPGVRVRLSVVLEFESEQLR